MKKIIFLTLICLVSIGLFSQVKQFSVTTSTGSDSIWMNTDTISFVAPHILANGMQIGTKNTSIYNLLWSYNADSAALGSDDYMFRDAFTKAAVIWIPWRPEGPYVIAQKVNIPIAREMMFEIGAIIDVTGELNGTYTFIDAGVQQIFTLTSNLNTGDSAWASSNVARPEWFGAIPLGVENAVPAIQKCIDIFKRNIVMDGNSYLIEGTININSFNTLKLASLTVLYASANTPNDPMFKISKEPFILEGGLISIPQGYHGWVFDIEIDRDGDNDRTPRFTSAIRNMIVRGHIYNIADYSGKAYKGVRLKSQKFSDYSYFSVMDNVAFYRPDTAMFLSGHPESGMSNSWHWHNITIDNTMSGIILDSRAAGHVFTNLIMQPHTLQHDGVETIYIDIGSSYNIFQGMIWDISHAGKVLRLRPGAGGNWINNFGTTHFYRDHVDDQSTKASNVVSTANPFEPTSPAYNYQANNPLSIGSGGVENASNAPSLTVFNKTSPTTYTPSIGVIRKSVGSGGELHTLAGTHNAISILTQRSDGNSNNRGHGGGIDFLSKHTDSDTTGPERYKNNIMSRVYGRKDINGSENDNKGLLQFWTKGQNASGVTMTLRNSGFVGIGTTEPSELLDLEFAQDVEIELGQGASDTDVTFITLRSPNGTKYYLTVADNGSVTASTTKP